MLKTFDHHAPTPETLDKVRDLRQAYSAVAEFVTATVPPSRERSVALTELETSAMWAIKAIVLNDPASVPENG